MPRDKRKPRSGQHRSRDRAKGGHHGRGGNPLDWTALATEVLDVMLAAGKPLTLREITAALPTVGADLDELTEQLSVLERGGGVLLNRRGRYALVEHTDLIIGRVVGRNDGRGRVIPIHGGREGLGDVILAPREMQRVLPDDRVLVRISRLDHQGNAEASVVALLAAGQTRVVGRFESEGGVSYVVPDDARLGKDVAVARSDAGGATPGEIVVVEILRHPLKDGMTTGRVIEVLGEHMAPGMEIEIAIRKHDLPHEWPEGVEEEAQALAVEVGDEDRQERFDLCDLPLVTIDGEDARDFDDAVYAEKLSRGWRLIVAIADVAHYVEADDTLDQEAQLRGNSVYFPRRVLPMLPEALSNGMCSLNPNVERLCMVCDMRLDDNGELDEYEFYEGVMRSHARLTYTEVGEFIDTGDAKRLSTPRVAKSIRVLHQLFKRLLAAREARGALDLDIPEANIQLDADERKIKAINARRRNDAHRLIEECMLMANVCAAEFVGESAPACLYRVHEAPDAERVAELRAMLSEFGLRLGGGDEPDAGDFNRLLGVARRQLDAKEFLQMVVLRSQQQARYSTQALGHFALNFESYAHFTSPIRRYADLVTHRQIKRLIYAEPPAYYEQPEVMGDIADQCSLTDRRAEAATRDVVAWLKAEYMLDKVGDVFDGVVTGVVSFGAFVRLEEVFIEGLVHISELGDDYYHFDPLRFQLRGERSGDIVRPGSTLRIRVARVDLDSGHIDFVPMASDERRERSRPEKSRRRTQGGRRGRRR